MNGNGVATVGGVVDTDDLGITLVHEHVLNTTPGIWRSWPELLGGREQFLDHAARQLAAARATFGTRTIVDLTPRDLGREVDVLTAVAERSGVQIVAASGLFGLPDATHASRTVDELHEFFVRELQVGMDGTGVRAGILKTASDRDGVSEFAERILGAVGRAHCDTGVPISLHSYAPGRVGLRQLEVLGDEGVHLSRVCVGHCDDVDEFDDTHLSYLTELAETGCWLGLDRYPGGPSSGGGATSRNWAAQVELLCEMVNRGFGDRILLSHDYSIGLTLFDSERQDRYFDAFPDGFLFIQRHVLPKLAEMGIDRDRVDSLLLDNPQRFLTPAQETARQAWKVGRARKDLSGLAPHHVPVGHDRG